VLLVVVVVAMVEEAKGWAAMVDGAKSCAKAAGFTATITRLHSMTSPAAVITPHTFGIPTPPSVLPFVYSIRKTEVFVRQTAPNCSASAANPSVS
jgi:hypothetical protein